MTAGDIQKMFGEEAYTAASILIQNVDAVERYTQAVTNTNIAVEQAAINSDTNRAKLEQQKNALKEAGNELIERLNPSLMTLTSLTNKIITALPKVIDWFIEYKDVVISTVAGISAYTVAIKASAIATKLYDTWTKIATVSTTGFNTVLKANPFGLVLAGLTALATYIMTKVVPATDAAAKSQGNYNEELKQAEDALKRFEYINSRYSNINKLNDRQKQNLKNDAKAELEIIEDKITKEEIAYQKQYEAEKKRVMDRKDINETTRGVLLSAVDNEFKETVERINQLKVQKDKLQAMVDEIPDIVTPETVVPGNGGTEGTDTDKPSAVEVATKAETERYYEELSQLKKSYLNSDTMTQKDYQALSEDLERQHLEKMLEIVGLEPEKRRQIQDKLLEMQIQYKEQCKQQDEQEKEENSELAFTRLEKEAQLKLDAAAQNHYAGLSSEREYHQQLLDIQNEYYNQVLSSTEISEEKKAEIMDRIQRDSLEKSRRNYEENQAKIREQLSFAQGIGQQFGEAFAEMLTDSETSLDDFMKATLGIILDSLQKMMIAYIAETQMKNIATLGFLGLAKAAAEIALITAAFQTAKAVINGFEEGGYTGYGKHDEPKGIVHAGEFVANRYAVSNPSVRPVLDLIDRAQKNNTIGSLTAKDVSAVLSGVSSTTNNTYYQQAAPADNGMSAIMLEAVKVMGSLNKRLNEPIYTYTKATGKMGINEAQDLVTRMKNNASRRIRL